MSLLTRVQSLLDLRIPPDRVFAFLYALLGFLLLPTALDDSRVLPLALGSGLLLLLFRPLPQGAHRQLGFPALVFLAYVPLTAVWSASSGLSLKASGLLLLGVTLWLQLRDLAPLLRAALESFALAAAGAAALQALLQWGSGLEGARFALSVSEPGEREILADVLAGGRAFSFLGRPGNLAAFLLPWIPLAFARGLGERGVGRTFHLGLAVLLAGGLAAAGGVAPWLALAAGAAAVLAIRRRWRAFTAILAGGTAAAGATLLFRGAEAWRETALMARLTLWEGALRLFREAPLFGSGAGTFELRWLEAGFPLEGGSRFAHNFLLQVLVEGGAAGALLLLVALAGLFSRLRPPEDALQGARLAGSLAFLLYGLVEIPFSFPGLVWFFVLPLSGISLASSSRSPAGTFESASLARVLPWALLAAVLLHGFFPPYRSWNLAVLAGCLFAAAGALRASFPALPAAVLALGAYLSLRVLGSPSHLGMVRFFQASGLLLAFAALLPGLPASERFRRNFFLLAIPWTAAFFVLRAAGWPPVDATGFPNPKHLAVFAVPLFFLLAWEGKARALVLGALPAAFLLVQKAGAALVGVAAGLVESSKRPSSPFGGRRRRFLAAALLLLAVVGAWRLADSSSTRFDRLWIWKDALKVAADHPLLGAGPGAFAEEYHRVKTPRGGFSRLLMDARYAHNEYLDFLVAFGGLGVLLAAACWSHLRRRLKALGQGERAGAAGLAAASAFDYCLHTPAVALGLAALAAPTSSARRSAALLPGALGALLAAALFGSAALAPREEAYAERLRGEGCLRDAYHRLRAAEALDPFRAKRALVLAHFENELFLETGDALWRRKADASLQRALAREPLQGALWLEAARLEEARLSRFPSPERALLADAAWRRALAENPKNAFAHLEAGNYFVKRGRRQEAREIFREAVRLEPNFASAWWNLSLLAAEEGREAEVRKLRERALSIRNAAEGLALDPAEKALLQLPPEAER